MARRLFTAWAVAAIPMQVQPEETASTVMVGLADLAAPTGQEEFLMVRGMGS